MRWLRYTSVYLWVQKRRSYRRTLKIYVFRLWDLQMIDAVQCTSRYRGDTGMVTFCKYCTRHGTVLLLENLYRPLTPGRVLHQVVGKESKEPLHASPVLHAVWTDAEIKNARHRDDHRELELDKTGFPAKRMDLITTLTCSRMNPPRVPVWCRDRPPLEETPRARCISTWKVCVANGPCCSSLLPFW